MVVVDYEQLRRLTISDTAQAKEQISELFACDDPSLADLLEKASKPGGSRIRQIIANVLRTMPAKSYYSAKLESWLAGETDEFTKLALQRAVRELGETHARQTRHEIRPIDARVWAYRYIVERLRHRLNNRLFAMSTPLERIRRIMSNELAGKERIDAFSAFQALDEMFIRLEDELGLDRGTEHFEMRPVELVSWLRENKPKLTPNASSTTIDFVDDKESLGAAVVEASDWLLTEVFKNLVTNSYQAVDDGSCVVMFRLTETDDNQIRIIVADNGPGFPDAARELVFETEFSTKSLPKSGRGLMEVLAAVSELHGSVALTDEGSVQIQLPRHS